MNWLEKAIKSLLTPSDYELISDKHEIGKLCEKIRQSLDGMVLISELNCADINTHEEKNWFESVVSPKERVIVLWPQESFSLKLNYAIFIKHYNELWYPSRDDIWIIDKTDFSWLIELNHEEVFKFCTAANHA